MSGTNVGKLNYLSQIGYTPFRHQGRTTFAAHNFAAHFEHVPPGSRIFWFVPFQSWLAHTFLAADKAMREHGLNYSAMRTTDSFYCNHSVGYIRVVNEHLMGIGDGYRVMDAGELLDYVDRRIIQHLSHEIALLRVLRFEFYEEFDDDGSRSIRSRVVSKDFGRSGALAESGVQASD